MPSYAQHMADAAKKDLTKEQQQKAGKPVKGAVGDEHKNFLTLVITMLKDGEIDVTDPQSFLNKDVYDALDEEWQDKVDLVLVNMTTQLEHIKAFHDDPSFSNDSPQLETMIEQLWQMKQEIEETHDVFKF